jgi:hypothetical protein
MTIGRWARLRNLLRPAFSLSEIKKILISPSFTREHLTVGPTGLQQPIAKKDNQKIYL